MLSASQCRYFSHLIAAGGVVAYPTETVYGLGCDPLQQTAVLRLLALKQRPLDKGLILLGANAEQLQPFVQLELAGLKGVLSTPTQHPTTWLIDKSPLTPEWVSGAHSKVAIRVTTHPNIVQLCLQLGFPLISTSANISTQATAENARQIQHSFAGQLDGIVPGQPGLQQASEIRDWPSLQVIRPAPAYK